MTDRPTILDRLQVAGLDAEIVAEWKDRHHKRTPCACPVCQAGGIPEPEPQPEPGQLSAFDDEVPA